MGSKGGSKGGWGLAKVGQWGCVCLCAIGGPGAWGVGGGAGGAASTWEAAQPPKWQLQHWSRVHVAHSLDTGLRPNTMRRPWHWPISEGVEVISTDQQSNKDWLPASWGSLRRP